MRLGEHLLKDGKLTAQELKFCLDVHRQNPGERLGEVVEYFGLASGVDIADFNAQKIGWQRFAGPYEPDWDVVERIGLEFLFKHLMYPLAGQGRPALVVAHIDMPQATDWLRREAGFKEVVYFVGVASDIRRELDDLALQHVRRQRGCDLVAVEDFANADSAVAWFDGMMQQAVLYGATDVHIEPTEKGVFVRFRIDGALVSAYVLPANAGRLVANIVLGRCAKNPSQFQVLLDGRFSLTAQGKLMDVRVSQIPLSIGPRLALRLLDQVRTPYSLATIGYSTPALNRIAQVIAQPYGIVLVTGPTGCGKTTTNHAILNELKDIQLNIMTVEDPVEVRNPGISQLQVNKDQEITFASALRSFLRQDPDVLMVGEIRDQETAAIAVQAAQTGHLLFSTLHTNNPVGAILRLLDLGVPRSNIASTLLAVISQRLVRKLCPCCKRPHTVQRQMLAPRLARYLKQEEQVVYEPQGCERCFHGYRGRTVVAEIMVLDSVSRSLIDQDRVGEMAALLQNPEGYQSIRHDARRLVAEGVSSLEEMASILG